MTSTAASTPRPSHKTPPAQPIKLYRSVISGHSHRVELFLSLLGLPYTCVDIDLVAKGHKMPAFLAMNAFGQVPVIQDGDITLADSNAILVYLAGRYAADAAAWFCAHGQNPHRAGGMSRRAVPKAATAAHGAQVSA